MGAPRTPRRWLWLAMAIGTSALHGSLTLGQTKSEAGQGPSRSDATTSVKLIRLVVDPGRAAPGDAITVTGADFGAQPAGRRLILRALTAQGRSMQTELTVGVWGPKALNARMPDKFPAGVSKAMLVLVDSKERVIGRGTVSLSTDEPTGAETARRERSETPPDKGADARRQDQKLDKGRQESRDADGEIRLIVDPGRIGPRDAFTVTGSEFGTSSEGRRLYLRIAKGTARPVVVPLTVSRWAGSRIEIAPARKLPADKGDADVVLVDSRNRVLGRGAVGLAADSGAGARVADGTPGGQRRGAGQESQADPRAGAGGQRRGAGQESQVDPRGQGRAGDRTQAGAAGQAGQTQVQRERDRMRQDQRRREMPIRPALALGGGGGKGAFQVGVLQNLYARGLKPVIITGTSAGALNGAKLAEGRPQSMDELAGVWDALTGDSDIYVPSPQMASFNTRNGKWGKWFSELSHIGDPDVTQIAKLPDLPEMLVGLFMDINAMDGVLYQRGLAERVTANLNVRAVRDSGIKLRLTAVERLSGDLRYFTENGDIELRNGSVFMRGRSDNATLYDETLHAPSVADGVMASSAIPIFFAPWIIKGGEYYWDGATVEGVPIRKALELGASDLVAIDNTPPARITSRSADKYTLTIERVRQAGANAPDDGSAGDYYARVKWGDRDWTETSYYLDDRDVSPRWRFENVSGDIALRIADFDSPDKNDRCDASPVDGETELRINFDPRRFTDAQHPSRYPIQGDCSGQIGDLIHVRGQGDDDPVEVWFRITPGTPGASSYLSDLPMELTPLNHAITLLNHRGSEIDLGDRSDLDVLDVLHEIAREVGDGPVLRSVRSFPLPWDPLMAQAYTIPRYVFIQPPIIMGDQRDFDPIYISFNIEVGKTVAKYTRIDFLDGLETRYEADGTTPVPTQGPHGDDDTWLEQHKRSEIMGIVRDRIALYREIVANPEVALAQRQLDEAQRRGDTNRIKGILRLRGETARRRLEIAQRYLEEFERIQEKLNDLQIVPPRRNPSR